MNTLEEVQFTNLKNGILGEKFGHNYDHGIKSIKKEELIREIW